jgi:hypothetical protein
MYHYKYNMNFLLNRLSCTVAVSGCWQGQNNSEKMGDSQNNRDFPKNKWESLVIVGNSSHKNLEECVFSEEALCYNRKTSS